MTSEKSSEQEQSQKSIDIQTRDISISGENSSVNISPTIENIEKKVEIQYQIISADQILDRKFNDISPYLTFHGNSWSYFPIEVLENLSPYNYDD